MGDYVPLIGLIIGGGLAYTSQDKIAGMMASGRPGPNWSMIALYAAAGVGIGAMINARGVPGMRSLQLSS